eukprot:CAMPEP_0116873042 /NCGR_PEP_ID=MMETSP0463-20121206/4002_1 /TAXON_ID=181622 /ORGANISM="Strombidinopsis sp, Strain SopsisLIS2011" /LENGTH=32 /DNA_ID= /DNA_START= /DNA_END= /DNA_ORIENTATION=
MTDSELETILRERMQKAEREVEMLRDDNLKIN